MGWLERLFCNHHGHKTEQVREVPDRCQERSIRTFLWRCCWCAATRYGVVDPFAFDPMAD